VQGDGTSVPKVQSIVRRDEILFQVTLPLKRWLPHIHSSACVVPASTGAAVNVVGCGAG